MRLNPTFCATLLSLMAAHGAVAANLYDKDGTKLDFYGRVVGMYYGSDDDDVSGDETYTRLGLKGESAIDPNLTGLGHIEYNLPTSGSDNDELRLGYGGLRHNTFGTLTYGRQDGLFAWVNDYTDVLPEFGGDGLGKGTEVFGTGRTNGLLKYSNSWNGLTVGVQFIGENDPQNDNAGKWMKGSDTGYAVGVMYDLPMGVSFATVFNQASKTEDQETDALFGGQNDAELLGVAARYDANNWYLAVSYAEGHRHYAIGDGYADKNRGYEAVVMYTFAEKFTPGLAYIRSDVEDDGQGFDDTANEYLDLSFTYRFNDHFQAFIDYRLNLLDENDFTRNYGIGTDDIVAIAIRYDF